MLNLEQVVQTVKKFMGAAGKGTGSAFASADDGPGEAQDMTCDDIAKELCRLALRLGSADNITVILVVFHW